MLPSGADCDWQTQVAAAAEQVGAKVSVDACDNKPGAGEAGGERIAGTISGDTVEGRSTSVCQLQLQANQHLRLQQQDCFRGAHEVYHCSLSKQIAGGLIH
eukprot:1027313-Rhodomonas_salina.1